MTEKRTVVLYTMYMRNGLIQAAQATLETKTDYISASEFSHSTNLNALL